MYVITLYNLFYLKDKEAATSFLSIIKLLTNLRSRINVAYA